MVVVVVIVVEVVVVIVVVVVVVIGDKMKVFSKKEVGYAFNTLLD